MADDQREREEVAINYPIPADLHSRAKVLAASQGRTLKAWILRAVTAEVERQEQARDEEQRRRRGR
jgi:predicted HicB family RNase H-like nuclease